MGGGSGLLCLRNTVALRIRVPPTFHPGPQLPTTAHGACPAPAHHGPAPRAICLLGQTTPSPSFFLALCPRQPRSSATPPPSWNQKNKKNKKNKEITGQTRPLRVAFWSSGKTEGIWRDDSRRRRGAKCFYCHTSRGWSKDLFMIPQFSLDNLDL